MGPRRLGLAPAAIAALMALGGGAGCVKKPMVSVQRVEVRSASLAGVGMVVYVEINNENSYDVQIRSVHAEVTIAGSFPLAPIDVTPNKWLPSKATTTIPVEVWIPLAIIPAVAVTTAGSTDIPYRVRGRADVTAVRALGIKRNDYPVSEEGTIKRQVLVDAARTVLPF